MNKDLIIKLLAVAVVIFIMIFFNYKIKYSTEMRLRTFDICMEALESKVLEDYELFKINRDVCKNIADKT